MTNKRLFDFQNPNSNALVVPSEEGGTEEDTYCSSIGDATSKHVSSLNFSQRQLWQDLILTRDGNIFRTEPSNNFHDNDSFSLNGEKIKESYQRLYTQCGKKLDESAKKAIDEIIEEEQKRRENSEDVYDKGAMIPYSLLEKYPGMTQHVSLPTTPKDRFIYMGNTKQIFYDDITEGHPNKKIIEKYIYSLNNDELTDKQLNLLKKNLSKEAIQPYVFDALYKLIDNFQKENKFYDQLVIDALKSIDCKYRIQYLNKVAEKSKDDIILQLMIWKDKEFKKCFDEGNGVFQEVKAFGQYLFKEHKSDMKLCHWKKYRKMKIKYAPRVLVCKKDINRTGVFDLMQIFNISKNSAINLWHNRPYESIAELRTKGNLNKTSFLILDSHEKYFTMIENVFEECLSKNSLIYFNSLAGKLSYDEKTQKKEENVIKQWELIWAYYKLFKVDLVKKINRKNKNVREKSRI